MSTVEDLLALKRERLDLSIDSFRHQALTRLSAFVQSDLEQVLREELTAALGRFDEADLAGRLTWRSVPSGGMRYYLDGRLLLEVLSDAVDETLEALRATHAVEVRYRVGRYGRGFAENPSRSENSQRPPMP